MIRLPNGRVVSRAEAEAYLELRREQHRRHEAKRLETEREAIIAKCATLHGFIEEFWYVLEPARRFVTGWAVQAMCAHLEAVTDGQFKRLLETVPPGMMKSLLLVFWTAWEWGPMGMPEIQVLATSYSQDNVHRDNLKLRDLVVSEKYQALWPLRLRADQNSKSKFINERGGLSWARPFGSMTGGRGDRVKIDDPHSTETAESDTERASTIRILREQITDRLNDVQTSAIVMIMQRLHSADAAAAAIEMGNYVHLNLPMRFEARRVDEDGKVTGGPCVTPIFTDPRTTDGELLFPKRFPEAEMVQMERDKGPYAWAGQYQQRPTAREGGMFQREWFDGRTIREAPLGTVWVRYWDLAGTELKKGAVKGARTAGVKMGRTPQGRYVIGHCVAAGKEGATVRKLVKATAELDGKSVEIGISQDPGQAGKEQVQGYIGLLAGWVARRHIESGDKATRAEPFSVQCEVGNVDLIEGPWNTEYLDEICLFPGGARKDIVDASSGAFGLLISKGGDPSDSLAGAEHYDRSQAAAEDVAELADLY